MRVLLTGATSFTGFWFVRALVSSGHQVIATTLHPRESYRGVRAKRAGELARIATTHFGVAFGHDVFVDLIRELHEIDVYCHHAAVTSGRHQADFDPLSALAQNVYRLPAVLELLRQVHCQAVVLSGSYFESGQGNGEEPERAVGAYGLSKTMTTQMMQHYCRDAGLPLGHFVIPNPFGPWDELRFVEYLMQQWLQGKHATVKTPYLVRDNIHVDLLAASYNRFVESIGNDPVNRKHLPSGYVESQGEFALRVAREMRTRLGMPCLLDLEHPQPSHEPVVRINTEPVMGDELGWSEIQAWDRFADYLHSHGVA